MQFQKKVLLYFIIMYRGVFFFKLLMHMNILSTNGLLNVFFFFEILTEYSVTILILQVLLISIMYIISDRPICASYFFKELLHI